MQKFTLFYQNQLILSCDWLFLIFCQSLALLGLLRHFTSKVPVFFRAKLPFGNQSSKTHNFVTAKGRILKFRTYIHKYIGYIRIILSANFGGNRSRDTGFRAKN